MNRKFDFSKKDKEKVEAAVRELELECSGEIVVFIAKQSDRYLEACWKAMALIGIINSVLIGGLSYFWMLPEWLNPFYIGILIVGTMLLTGLLLLIIPTARLSLILNSTIEDRVLTRARDMFLQEEVFNTIDRTGILIYISKFEHQVDIIGDSGINQKIESKDWSFIVGEIVNGIKNDRVADGLESAIHSCKKLLLDHGFVRRDDDINEISDEVRIED